MKCELFGFWVICYDRGAYRVLRGDKSVSLQEQALVLLLAKDIEWWN